MHRHRTTKIANFARLLVTVGLSTAAVFTQAAAPTKPAPPTAARDLARLLPEDTLIYVRVADAVRFRDVWSRSSVGRMSQDAQFKPLLDRSWEAVEKAFEPMRERLGLTLAELIELPRGELAAAVVPIEGTQPALVVSVETPDDDRAATTLIDSARRTVLDAGWIEQGEQVGDVDVTIFRSGAGRSQQIAFVRFQGALVVGTHIDAVRAVLERHTGKSAATLADAPAFQSLDRLVGRAENEPADLFWYVDPIRLIRQSTQGNTSAAVGLAMLPVLGLDGLTAVGGSAAFQRGPFETIGQAYVLLDVPRSGLVELVALQPTPTEPEAWVFNSIGAYATFCWDVERTFHQLRKVVDDFQGEGTLRRATVERLKTETDIDLETEILPELTGRISFLWSLEEPLGLQGRARLWGVQVKNHDKAEKLLARLVDRFAERVTKKSYAGRTFYEAVPRSADDARPRGAVALLDDYLLLADRASVLEKALAAAEDESVRLAAALDYKLIASKAARYAGENGPGLLWFSRPEEEVRFWHGVMTSEQVREGINRRGERNPLLGDLGRALDENPLPPIETLQHYYAPAGAVVLDEPTGLRYLSFVLKRDDAKQ